MLTRQITTSEKYRDITADSVFPLATDSGIYVADLRNVNFAIFAKDSFEGTVKLLATTQTNKPDFSSPATVDNHYVYVNSVDMATDDRIDGNTGLVFTGAEDGSYVLQLNVDLVTWVALEVTNYSAGSVDFFVTSGSNV